MNSFKRHIYKHIDRKKRTVPNPIWYISRADTDIDYCYPRNNVVYKNPASSPVLQGDKIYSNPSFSNIYEYPAGHYTISQNIESGIPFGETGITGIVIGINGTITDVITGNCPSIFQTLYITQATNSAPCSLTTSLAVKVLKDDIIDLQATPLKVAGGSQLYDVNGVILDPLNFFTDWFNASNPEAMIGFSETNNNSPSYSMSIGNDGKVYLEQPCPI